MSEWVGMGHVLLMRGVGRARNDELKAGISETRNRMFSDLKQE